MKIFSFFAGVGMLDLGFQDAGYDVVFVNEFKQEFMDSYCYARQKHNYNLPIYGYHVKDNDIISVRQMGRFQYEGVLSETKKGRYYVTIRKYT